MGKSCWDCIHCDVCANIDGFSRHVSNVSKCKHFKDKVDIEPVKHGEWAGTVCCCCGESTVNYYDCDYCPNCGAKMDGKEVQE